MISEVEQSFGVPAIVQYGAVECGLIAGEWPDRTLRVREDLALVETLPRDDGRFDIVLTVLANPSFPLIRYSIGDITDAPLEIPARGPATLGNIAGRDGDLVISRSGRRIHVIRFDAIFEHNEAIRRFRVHQGADGALSTLVEVNSSSASLDTASLEQKLTDLVEGYPVKLEVVDALPQTASRKHRYVISDFVDKSLL